MCYRTDHLARNGNNGYAEEPIQRNLGTQETWIGDPELLQEVETTMFAPLENISLFRGLRDDELHALTAKTVTKTFFKNLNVVREGIPVSDEYFAFKPARDKSQYFTQIYRNKRVLQMINESADKARIICKLRIREQRSEDPLSSYWGWLPKNGSNGSHYEMIMWSRLTLESYFAYGINAAEKSGKGKAVNLHVEVVE